MQIGRLHGVKWNESSHLRAAVEPVYSVDQTHIVSIKSQARLELSVPSSKYVYSSKTKRLHAINAFTGPMPSPCTFFSSKRKLMKLSGGVLDGKSIKIGLGKTT